MRKLFIIVLLLASIKTVNSQWQQSGLSGIDTREIGVTSTGILYAATANGYVHKSTNHGVSWFISSPLLYNALDLDIKSNGYIFLTNTNGIYRSSDEGNSWQLIYGPTTSVTSLEILSNGNLIAGTLGQGPYISTNNGTNWSPSNNGLNQTVISLKVDNASEDIYAGTYYDGVYKSTNSGSSWFHSLLLEEYILDLTISVNGDIYCGATGYAKIFKSSDNGGSWQQVLSLGSNLNSVHVLLHLPNGNILAGTSYTGIFQTSNNGLNWTSFNDGLSSLNIYGLALDSQNFIYAATSSDGIYKRPANNDITIGLTMSMEGFYNSQTSTQIGDTVKAYLRIASFPFSIVDSAKAFVGSNGTGTLRFLNAPNGTYYLVIKHRNTIETWSRSGGAALIRGQTTPYDFTNLITQAYGSNMVLKGSKYCFYSGDVNQDGAIDLSDLGLIDNDVFNFNSGYVAADVNGDGFVDISDLEIADNNGYNFVIILRP